MGREAWLLEEEEDFEGILGKLEFLGHGTAAGRQEWGEARVLFLAFLRGQETQDL